MNKNIYKIRLIFSFIIFTLSILAITGLFYGIKIFNIQLLPLIQRNIIDFSFFSLLLLVIVLSITLIFGRVYCSILCPLGILQELINYVVKKRVLKPFNLSLKYFVLFIVLAIVLSANSFILKYIDSFTLFSNILDIKTFFVIFLMILIPNFLFKNRVFCTNICPIGTLLGLISKYSLFKITIKNYKCLSCKLCEKNCPTNSIDMEKNIVNNETCIKCLKCVNVCDNSSILYSKHAKEKKEFSLSRRKFILTSASLLFLTFLSQSKIKLNNFLINKKVILPPGVQNKEEFINSCLNCNLCVENCPHNVIKSANQDFPSVHLDYSDNFCKFECVECAKNCPSGAIKKITLEEKQNTQIAIAKHNKSKCKNCQACVAICPTNAITIQNCQISINVLDCIGCGSCKNACVNGAMSIEEVEEQTLLHR